MVLLVLVLLLVLGLLCAVLSFVVHHLFLVGVVAAVGAVVLVGRAHQVTPTSVRTDLRQDLHVARVLTPAAPARGRVTPARS